MSENCVPFMTDDPGYDKPWMGLLRCPACKGWLPGSFTEHDEFTCKKCGEVLTVLWDEGEYTGRICKMPEHLKPHLSAPTAKKAEEGT